MIKKDTAMCVTASLILIFTALLLWFKTSLNSDSLFFESFSKDLFDLGGKWSDWMLCNAPAYFPDMLLYFLAYKFFPNAIDRIFFVSVAQVFILAWAVLWVSKQIYPKISKAALAVLLLLLAFTTLVAARSNMWLYFYSTHNHFAALLMPLLSIGLIIRFYIRPSIFPTIGLFLAGVAGQTSTAIYLISFFIPIVLLALLIIIIGINAQRKYKVHLNRVLWILGILMTAFLASLLIQFYLTFHGGLNDRIFITAGTAIFSFQMLLGATINVLSLDNMATFIFSIFILLSFIFLIITASKFISIFNKDGRLAFCGALLLIALLVNISGAIITGGMIDYFCYRYITFPIALVLILPVIILDKISYFSSKLWMLVFSFLCFLLVVFSIPALNKSTFIPIENTRSDPAHAEQIAECLIGIEKKGFVLQEGVGDFWNARGVSEYLPKKNWILTAHTNLFPKFWITSIEPLQNPDRYQYHYNFLILHNFGGADDFRYDSYNLQKSLPVPSQVYKCPKARAEIWLYSNNNLDAIIKEHAKEFRLLHQNRG